MLEPHHCSLNPERLTLSANSSDATRVVATVVGTSLEVRVVKDWHTIGFRPVVVSVTATDLFNMSAVFAFNVTVFSINNNPAPELAPVEMVGNGESRRINITTLQVQPCDCLRVNRRAL